MNWYEEKQEQRKEALEAKAERLTREANAKIESGMGRLRQIPFGQPILIGHHSEGRDRNFRRKAVGAIDKGMELRSEAADVARRAEAVGNGGISSDDPDAVDKLKLKLAGLELAQQQMKAINAAWRKAGKPKADNADAWAAIARGSNVALEAVAAARASMARDFMSRPPFTYQLQNNNGNISRVKDRIGYLERNANRETKAEEIGGIKLVENAEINRVQIIFPGKPSADVRAKLKQSGFRWSPSEGAWQRQLNSHAVYWAKDLIAKLNNEEVKP